MSGRGSVAWIGLGSNVGPRRATLRRAIGRLGALGRLTAVSRAIETEAVVPEEIARARPAARAPYVNAVIGLDTELEPRALMDALLAIERQLGRVRSYRGAPRPIDLDLLLYADRVIDEPGLVVPHPRLQERSFVLQPLLEVAPELRHPVLDLTVAELWRELAPDSP